MNAPHHFDNKNISLSLVGSALFHVFILFGLTFSQVSSEVWRKSAPSLDVVLVNSHTNAPVKEATKLAQANLDGGGNVDGDRYATTPLPVLQPDSNTLDPVESAEKKVKDLEQKADNLMSHIRAQAKLETIRHPDPQEPQQKVTTTTTDLVDQSLEAARLQAQIEKNIDIYQKRPRRKFVGSRTQEFSYARYIEDWRIKVERIGNLNYPEEARRNKVYGSLQITVSIRADGSIENIELNRSSGSDLLDKAAMRILKISAPFSPFSEEMRKEIDVLSITRTWSFTHDDELISQ